MLLRDKTVYLILVVLLEPNITIGVNLFVLCNNIILFVASNS